jgi:pyruvate dehydrogenase E2 component (dihydrolipoamide acetyltransferase)
VGEVIAIVGDADEEIADAPELAPAAEPEQAPEPAPTHGPIVTPPPAQAAPEPAATTEVRASPVARRIADERGIDLKQIVGTGPGGRITKSDVESFQPSEPSPEPVAEPAATAPKVEPVPAPSTAETAERVELTRMRQQIARVTVRSKQEIPHFYVSAEIDMTQAMEIRGQINAALESEGIRVSVNDLIIKASVTALKKHPKFNAYFVDDGLRVNEAINIGIAIAEEEGLIVPAILDCGDKSLAEVSAASKDLVRRSQSGTLHPQEYTGGTFSISNLGMFDVTSFAAIIHPPQSAVLAVGTVAKRPVVRDGAVTIAQMMTATLSADHRVADGAEGAQFLIEVKRLLENPLSLLA